MVAGYAEGAVLVVIEFLPRLRVVLNPPDEVVGQQRRLRRNAATQGLQDVFLGVAQAGKGEGRFGKLMDQIA